MCISRPELDAGTGGCSQTLIRYSHISDINGTGSANLTLIGSGRNLADGYRPYLGTIKAKSLI